LVGNDASWDNSRSGFQLKIQVKTLPNGFGILVLVCQTDALRFGTNRAPPVRGGICSERELSQLAAARTGNDFSNYCADMRNDVLRFGTNRAPLGRLAPVAGIVSGGGLQI